MIVDFLKTKTPKEKLVIALEVLREFKKCESQEEWIGISFFAWAKLEQYDEFLDFLVNGSPLKEDTIEQLKKHSPMFQTILEQLKKEK